MGSLPYAAFVVAMVKGWNCTRGGGMGIDMQIVYLGFAGSAQIESEAAAQLVRLERFGKTISGCHLAIEAVHGRALSETSGARSAAQDAMPSHLLFDARLDLVLRSGELMPLKHRQSEDPDDAVRASFDAAERLLERGITHI